MKPGLALFLLLSLAMMCVSAKAAHAEERLRRGFEIEWEAIDGATYYEVRLTRKGEQDKKPTLFKTKENKWEAAIKPGLYEMQIRSFDERGVPGDFSPPVDLQVKLPSVVQTKPMNSEVVKASDENSADIRLGWESVPGAEKYKVNIRSLNGNWQAEHEVSDPHWEVKVPVAQAFEWSVTALDMKGEAGDVGTSGAQFEVKGPALEKPKLFKPMSKYVRDVSWSESAKAEGYSYELSFKNPRTKKWETIDSNDDLKATKLQWEIARPSGRYRLKVQAHAARREPSKLVQIDFDTRGGFRDPAALETAIMRDSIEKPTDFYAIASYLYTTINYAAVSQEQHNAPAFKASGGTGRLGAGYQDPESKWGGFFIADLSGFTIENKTFTFAAAEAHATRKLEFGQGGLLLFGTGLYFKELPAVQGNQQDGYIGTGKVSQIGPHAGFTYWLPFSDRFGAQLNARTYYSLLGRAPNGEKTQGTLSYQYGLLGSYRLTKTLMGFLGYAHRLDSVSFGAQVDARTSFAQPGQMDTIKINGDYFNLLLEYSF